MKVNALFGFFTGLMVATCVALPVVAAPTTFGAPVASGQGAQSKSALEQWKTIEKQLKGLSLVAFYNLADDITAEGSLTDVNGQKGDFKGAFTGEKAAGFAAEYNFMRFPTGVGLTAGGSYELARKYSKIKGEYRGDKIDQDIYEDGSSKPEINFMALYGNVDYLVTSQIQVFGGGNYSFVDAKNTKKAEYKGGKLGFQVGAAYAFSEHFAIDMMYRRLYFDVNDKGASYDKLYLGGAAVRTRYMF